jgi:hypothetical protein
MKSRLFTHAGVCCLIAAGVALSLLGIASAQDVSHPAARVTAFAAGSDYLQTGPGTEASLPVAGKMMKVGLTGVPIKGQGNTDTIIERTQDAVFPTANVSPETSVTIPITLTALSLTGTVPGPNGGSCTVNITLASSPASTGTLTINSNGTYSSQVTVYFMETFTPIPPNTTCYPPITTAQPCKLEQKLGYWSTHPLSGEYEVVGPYGDQQANVHTNLPPGYGDFYITSLQSDTAATAKHITCEALAQAGTPCPPKVTPGNLNFGTVALGTTSAAQTVTVTNQTTSVLTFGTISIVGTDHVDFGQTNNCVSLPAGGSCTISVTFTPGAAGALTANLQINESSTGSPELVALSGTGQ